jgi:hypothetical protein
MAAGVLLLFFFSSIHTSSSDSRQVFSACALGNHSEQLFTECTAFRVIPREIFHLGLILRAVNPSPCCPDYADYPSVLSLLQAVWNV